MKRQQSFQNDLPTLYLVATPIGNLQEMNPRAIEILNHVAVIAAEDTRNTLKLLQHFQIDTRLISHHMHNESDSANGIIKLLESGQDVALVSDAGYPLISDPGYILVNEAIEKGYNVVPISGSSASLDGLIASGLIVQPHLFYGFLPLNDKEFIHEVNQLKAYPYTLIFYEAPHRIGKTIAKLIPLMGDRKACLAREITKKFEEFIRGNLSEIQTVCDELKGEMVLIIQGNIETKGQAIDLSEINEQIQRYIDAGVSASSAIKQVAKDTGLNKNELYQYYHDKQAS